MPYRASRYAGNNRLLICSQYPSFLTQFSSFSYNDVTTFQPSFFQMMETTMTTTMMTTTMTTMTTEGRHQAAPPMATAQETRVGVTIRES